MKIAIASGKGGTGKTTFAVNLALVLADRGAAVQYVDCDVEEPNGHLFLKPDLNAPETVAVPVPRVDEEACTGCGRCAEVCRYGAIAVAGKPLVFPGLCHGCGGCALACPEGAIREHDRPVGVVETGRADGVAFAQGRLNVGETMATPVIRAAKARAARDGTVLLDAPPGTACPVVSAVRGVDYVLLVTEPTPFGLHDLRLAVEMLRALGLPHGVAVNRADAGDGRVGDYCVQEGLPILVEMPEDRRVAEACARGELAARVLPEWTAGMTVLWERLGSETGANA